jgi:hypothetical protein
MEKETESRKINLVLTRIGPGTGNAWADYHGEYDYDKCPVRVSFRSIDGALVVPLWFPDDKTARAYQKKVETKGEKEFFLIQEFTYKDNNYPGEAKILFHVKSDDYPHLAEGDTERSPGIWAHVRSIFLCDTASMLDYVSRFNKDCAAAYEVGRKK